MRLEAKIETSRLDLEAKIETTRHELGAKIEDTRLEIASSKHGLPKWIIGLAFSKGVDDMVTGLS